MKYQELLAQKRPGVRPEGYEALLFQVVADNPTAPNAVCYSNWEFDHGHKQRFYVAGFRWFMKVTGIENMQVLTANYAKLALDEVKTTTWPEMPNSANRWSELSPNQLRAAKNIENMFFQKAALVMLVCEKAIEARLDSRTEPLKTPVKPGDVYTNMAVVPAVWTIEDFNKKVLDEVAKAPGLLSTIREVMDQPAQTIDGMASGHTVTNQTAFLLKQELTKAKINCGPVRARASLDKGPIKENLDAG